MDIIKKNLGGIERKIGEMEGRAQGDVWEKGGGNQKEREKGDRNHEWYIRRI